MLAAAPLGMATMATAEAFLSFERFAVVGASKDRSKFGNKVLRCYAQHQRAVTPVHPKESAIEGLPAVSSVGQLEAPTNTAVSIVTPPKITLNVISEAAQFGITHLWLQPGSEDAAVLQRCSELGLSVISGGPCLLTELGFDPSYVPAAAAETQAEVGTGAGL